MANQAGDCTPTLGLNRGLPLYPAFSLCRVGGDTLAHGQNVWVTMCGSPVPAPPGR